MTTKKAQQAAPINKNDGVEKEVKFAVFGESVPQGTDEIDIKYIGEFCLQDEEKAKWFAEHIYDGLTSKGKKKKKNWPKFRREFCLAYFPEFIKDENKEPKKDSSYYLNEIKNKFNIE